MNTAPIELIAALRAKGFDKEADAIIAILEQRDLQIKELTDKIGELENRYQTVSHALDHFIRIELDHYTHIKEAFPQGDILGHRMYHEKCIKSAEAQEAFWLTMKTETLKKGFFWTTVAILGLLAIGFQVKIKAWLGLDI